MIKKNENGFYLSDDPLRFFALERDAINHQKFLLMRKQLNRKEILDQRRLNDLIGIWYKMHGKTLRDHKRLERLLFRISERMNNPIASFITAEQFALYREERIKEVSTATANREHSYLKALFNELKRMNVIQFDNPLPLIRKFKERQGGLRYLTKEEQASLLNSCKYSSNSSLIYVVKICLATGARWSEAENLKASQIKLNRITFLDTKSCKNRTLPINEILFNELLCIIKNEEEKLFVSCISAFRKAIEKSKIQLPNGQMTHVLRHSFASHFVTNGGNIVVLQKILGHSEVTTTMRYAHLMPDHLNEVLRLNPLNQHQ